MIVRLIVPVCLLDVRRRRMVAGACPRRGQRQLPTILPNRYRLLGILVLHVTNNLRHSPRNCLSGNCKLPRLADNLPTPARVNLIIIRHPIRNDSLLRRRRSCSRSHESVQIRKRRRSSTQASRL